MKKLLILTAVVMLTTSSLGCNHCRWGLWNRGAACNTCNTCNTYATGPAIIGESYVMPGPLVMPGSNTIISPAPN